MVDIKVPAVGESITEGTIARWLKKDGAQVQAEEPIFELETEKASTEVPAPESGVLHIRVAEGKTVAIGSVVGTIEPGGASAKEQPEKSQADNKQAETSKSRPEKPAAPPDEKPGEEPAVSPAARRLSAEEGVDAGKVKGTGKGGVVLKEDVQKVVDDRKQSAAVRQEPTQPTPLRPAGERESRQRMSAIRARIADRLVTSQQTTASLTTFNEADMTAVLELRTRFKEQFKEKHGVGLGFMSFFVKAAIEALKAYPLVNARIEDSDIVQPDYYNIGVAVSTEKGLMVPVLRAADQMSFADIEKKLVDLATRARDGKINVQDLQGGTFTITNGGVFGSMLSTPILNPPQSGILGMHSIQKRPVAVGDQVVIRPMMYLALTYDHRLVDGREAVLFLVRVKECIENPERMLLDV